MARGKDLHDAHAQAVARLGKDLSRRAGHRCELCNGDADLRVVEVPPTGEEPDVDAAMLACARCRDLTDSKKLPRDTGDLRFLEGSAWADPVPVKVSAIRLLRRLSDDGVAWARECLDGVWIDDDVAALLEAS